MKKRIIYSLLIIILILGLFFGYHYLNKSSFIKTNNTNDKQIIDSRLAILIESVPGSGNYENATSFSSSGYYINTELTKCDHGSEITWNSENQTISLSSDGDDKCHLYFEAILESIAITTNPTTTTYNKGATFSNSGMVVTATYSNNYSKAITDYNYTAPSLADAGTKTYLFLILIIILQKQLI